jgi:putative transposase
MDVLQIDHTRADVTVVDQEHRLPIGRPWLTLAIDIATPLMVAGFHVSLWAPSALSVSVALFSRHTVKDAVARRPGITQSGLASERTASRDSCRHNAKEFHSEPLVRGCQEIRHLDRASPAATTALGGHIERLIGTMIGALHLLPGTPFSDVNEKKARMRARHTHPTGTGTVAGSTGEKARPQNRGSKS